MLAGLGCLNCLCLRFKLWLLGVMIGFGVDIFVGLIVFPYNLFIVFCSATYVVCVC